MSITAISVDAMLPALGMIGTDLSARTQNEPQLVIGLFFLGLAIGQLLAGPISDATGRKRLLIVSVGLYIGGALICVFAASMAQIFTGRFIQGLGASGPAIASVSIVRDKFEGRKMARIMSMIMMIFILAPILAPLLGQTILTIRSWHAIFVFFIIHASAITLWLYFRLGETLPPAARRRFSLNGLWQSAKRIVAIRSTLFYATATGCIFAGFLSFLFTAQQIFNDIYNVGKYFPLYFAMLAASFGAASLLNARWVESYGMRFIVIRALVLMLVVSVFNWVLSKLGLLNLPMFMILAMLSLFCVGLLYGNLFSLAMEPLGDIAGTASSVVTGIANAISIPLGILIGMAFNGTTEPLAIGMFISSLLSIALVLRAQKHGSRVKS